MKYLFFDLEFASSKGDREHICEFGFVVTNEQFDILDRGNFIINPNLDRSDWDWRVVKKILTRRIFEYEKEETFPRYYNEIKYLIKEADFVFGHSTSGDAKALNCDCERYNLPSLDFDFYDIKEFYKCLTNTTKSTSVKDILESLHIQGDEKEHDAEADAYNTMLELKGMLEKYKVNLGKLIESCPNAKDRTENYVVQSIAKNHERTVEEANIDIYGYESNKLTSVRSSIFKLFKKQVRPQEGFEKNFEGLKICFSLNYEKTHYRQMLNLVQLLCNHGACIWSKASESNIFVDYVLEDEEGQSKSCKRALSAKEYVESGQDLKIISLDELLNRMGLAEKELDDMPLPSFDWLFDENIKISNPRLKQYVKFLSSKEETNVKEESNQEKSTVTLGDIFGDALDALAKDLED